MKIGLDFDGVVTNRGKQLSALTLVLMEKVVPLAIFNKKDILTDNYLSIKQYQGIQFVAYETSLGLLFLKPVDGMKKTLLDLLKKGHDVSIITSRSERGLDLAKRWLKEQDLRIPIVGVGQGNSKAQAARGLDLFVDDSADKLVPLIGIVPNLFLFSWEYNAHEQIPEEVKRVFSWEKLYENIQNLS